VSLQHSTRPPSWFKGALLLRGGEGKGRKGVEEGRGGRGNGMGMDGREGEGEGK